MALQAPVLSKADHGQVRTGARAVHSTGLRAPGGEGGRLLIHP